MKKNNRKPFLIAFLILSFTAFLMTAASLFPELFFPGYRQFSASVMTFLSGISEYLPIPLWELLLCALILLLIFSLGRMIHRKQSFLRWFGRILTVGASLFCLFTLLWGMDHYAPPLADELDLEISETSESELIEATKYYMALAEYYAERQERGAAGAVITPDTTSVGAAAGRSYVSLSQEYPIFAGSSVPVKSTCLSSTLLSYTGTTGIFVCFTGESCINPQVYVCSLPHTMCHEAAHRCGIAAEDEANFAGFLACINSEDLFFRYSGYYSAFLYCYNALYDVNSSAALKLWNTSNDILRSDLRGATAHYAPYEGKVQDAAQAVNDVYLKAFSEEDGVQSYGKAADYLICWYLQKIR